ncbi:MAG: energy-coupling factor transporter transmembrane protein EcfT [Treponema sp.]|jgi:energy-coupling factor transport system permease protein|nr:energy-coupling factor transporter transmembrane protein EcfT [Treponema sp.]
MRERRGNLDPRTKLLILVFINMVIFTCPDLYTEWLCMALISAILLLMGAYCQTVRGLAIYAIIMVILYVCGLVPGFLANFVFMMMICFRRIMPAIFFASGLIATTRVSDIISALQKLHMPKSIIIPFAVTLRFFPTAKEEFLHIRDAMKLRGISISVKNIVTRPLTLLERIAVPMILRCANIAEELSAAAVTRGIESEGRRTSLRELNLHAADAASSAAFATLSVVTVLRSTGIQFPISLP